MTDEELNTALYKKMFAEQEKYREWLLGQPPEEVLNHSYEYTMREDILLSLEYDDIDGALAQALLASPSPLEDVFQAFESVEDGHMAAIRDCIIDRAGKELEKQRMAPVYTQPPDYAREHGELDKYRESKRLNVLCKEAIEQTVRDNYKDNRLDADAVWRDVTAQFGSKRAAFVLAMTVREKDYDGRFSRENKAWAKSQPLPPDPEHRGLYCSYVVDKAHPVLTDALVTHARRELERQKKPSVKEKLQSAETPPRTEVKAAAPEL